MEYIPVATLEEIPSGQTKMVQVGQCSILMIHAEGTFYAVQGWCAHQQFPLTNAEIWRGVLDCPWHHFQYDIRTGENLYPKCVYPLAAVPRLQSQIAALQTYAVRVVDQEIQVAIPTHCTLPP